MRTGNKATSSCRYCSVWGSRTPSRRCGNRWKMVSVCSRSSTTFMFYHPERTRVIYDLLATTLRERAGIQLHTGKTRTWNFAGECPVDMEELGPDVWNPIGTKILGTPVGHDEFVANLTVGRGAEIVGRNPLNPRLAMFVAGAPPVRRASMSSSVAHGSTTTVCRICAWARFWDAAHDGSIVGEDPRKPNAGRDGTQHHHSTHEDGRCRFEVCREDGARCILFMG